MTNKATPRVVKALSNSIRLNALYELNLRGTARTSDLANALELAPNKMSYHLKILHDAGVIESATGEGDGRETWWRAVQGGWEVDDPTTAPALSATLAHLETVIRERSEKFSAELAQRSQPSVRMNGDILYVLSRDDAESFSHELTQLYTKYVAISDRNRSHCLNDDGEVAATDFLQYDFRFGFLPVADVGGLEGNISGPEGDGTDSSAASAS
ncbi:ArsR/SmtB family transcription factor [Arcanobacterium canis]|uniref:ArsR family transcriptional regulator n=1 Tax=Arcanobacterium canis TaxID=999183 RepID=A0ABY8FWW5_9ACTO|nr:ArsR family transcriptional regulator [Arcanobacterium canis]WFM82983.1 ArsR family transcriptional regulator [Arcanobacterium canis]